MNLLLGIDVGTTNTKVLAFDPSGNQVAIAVEPTVTLHSAPGRSEYDALQIWASTASCLRKMMEALPEAEIVSIGVSSFGESAVLVDEDGEPLHHAIAWFDMRAQAYADSLARDFGTQALYGASGQFLSAKFGLPKILFLRDALGNTFHRAKKLLSMEDWILYRLTGKFCTDYSMAARSMMLDVRQRAWNEGLLAALSIPHWLLPKPLPGGALVGETLPKIAASTGLPAGIPVSTGGHDHACAAAAASLIDPSTVLNSLGTSEVIIGAMDGPVDVNLGFARGICTYPHFGRKNPYRFLTSMQASGASAEWALRLFGAPKGVEDPYTLLLREAAQVSEPTEMIFLPYIRGLMEDPSAKGAILGIRDTYGRPEYALAVLEGVAMEILRTLEACQQATGRHFSTVRAAGGLSKSAWYMGLRASLMNRNVEISASAESAARGAALLGAIGAGVLDEKDIPSWYVPGECYAPEARCAEEYKEKYRRFLAFANALRNDWK